MYARPLPIILLLVSALFGQSGRVKPETTPAPRKESVPAVVLPTRDRPRVAAPTPTPSSSNQNDEEIRVESTLVPIPVTVVNAKGDPVEGLKIADFTLKVDGRPAEISEVFRSESPVRLVLLFDNSGSVAIAREFEKDAAIKFFRKVIRPDKDLAALYSVATAARLEQPFTSDISSLTRSIDMFPAPDGATALLDAIVKASDYLAGIAGRRVMVIVSDGDDTYSGASLEDALRSLTQADCQVFVVKTTDFENYVRTGSRQGNANIRQLAAERRMIDIVNQTGGAVYSPVDQREVDEAFRQIVSELSRQYILAYYPDDTTGQQGKFREISLTVNSTTPVTVRTRKGYYVPKR